MVKINIFSINSEATELNVSVETNINETITSAVLWKHDTFKDYNKSIDLTSYLEQNSNLEVFTVPASILNEDVLKGIYFIEFETSSTNDDSECTNCNNTLGVATSLTCFKEYILNLTLSYKVCDDCTACKDNDLAKIINANTILKALCSALEFGYYGEAIDLYNTLQKICKCSNPCKSCKDLQNPTFKTGYDYGTLDNTLILL